MLLYQKPTETVRVQVKWRDILLGKRGHSGQCMVARAVKRQFPGAEVYVTFDSAIVYRSDMDMGKTLVFSEDTSKRIRDWDFGQPGRPFSLEATFEATYA